MIQTALLSSSGTSARAEHPGAGGVVLGRRLATDSWPTYAIVKRPWVTDTLDRVGAQPVAMATDLLGELGEKANEASELVAVVALPADDFSRIPVGPGFLGVVFDRPSSPGNIGTIIRSVDAFGGSAVIVTGHAADPYDPKAVRASTGSLFAVPVVRTSSHREVLDWVQKVRSDGIDLVTAGTDEKGVVDVARYDLTRPSLVLIGNETSGLSAGWRDSCDCMVRIPISGSVSSLNAANAASVVLYEAARQRAGQSG